MMISMDGDGAQPAAQAREPRVHAAPGARPRADDPPHLHRDHRPGGADGRVRLRLGHRRAAAPAHDRRHARLPARVLRRPAALVRRPDPRHHGRRSRGDAGGGRSDARLPGAAARGHRRPPVEAAAGRPRQHPVPRRDRRRAARRRVDHQGEPADPHRRRRDDPPRDDRRDARPARPPGPAGDPARRSGGDGGRRRGAAALGVADQEHVPHGDARRRAARPDAARGRPGGPDVPVGQPRRGRLRRPRPARRAARPQPAPRLRVRPALLHGRVARPARARR